LDRRIDSKDMMAEEMATWEKDRNDACTRINWLYTTTDARIKHKRLYPSFDK
jgi:hypothetical protein